MNNDPMQIERSWQAARKKITRYRVLTTAVTLALLTLLCGPTGAFAQSTSPTPNPTTPAWIEIEGVAVDAGRSFGCGNAYSSYLEAKAADTAGDDDRAITLYRRTIEGYELCIRVPAYKPGDPAWPSLSLDQYSDGLDEMDAMLQIVTINLNSQPSDDNWKARDMFLKAGFLALKLCNGSQLIGQREMKSRLWGEMSYLQEGVGDRLRSIGMGRVTIECFALDHTF